MIRPTLCSLAASVVFATNVAFAQQTTSTSDAAAEANAAIERGIVARQRGDDDEAIALFRRAYAMVPSARAQAQIALAEQALGQWVAAERDLTAALQLTSDPWIVRNETVLRTALGQIQERLATLEVRVSTENAEVRINEQPVGRVTTTPFRVPSGTVTVEVSAQGFITQRRTVEVAPRARWREVFNLVTASATNATNTSAQSNGGTTSSDANARNTNPPPRAEPERPARTQVPIAPIVVGGVGVASLALGGVFAALRGQAMGSCPFDMATNTLVCATQMTYEAAIAGRTWTTATNVTLIGGAVVTVGAGVWLAVSLATAPRVERNTGRRLFVAPSLAASGDVGVLVGGAL